MKISGTCFRLVIGTVILAVTHSYYVDKIVLNGSNLTPEIIENVANGKNVAVATSSMEHVQKAFDTLVAAAESGQAIYGFTTGVGLNKDVPIIDVDGKLTPEVIDASREFQIGLLRAHSGGIGVPMSIPEVRATMVSRLNMFLSGGAGVQPLIVNAYVQFLNHGISPIVPRDGSMGEADITVISHIGLAMLGEGDVYYRGKKESAKKALERSGVPSIKEHIYGKDGLAILSSNANSAAVAALALGSFKHMWEVSAHVFILCLEALNGNVAPFLEDTLKLRPFPKVQETGTSLRNLLEGSYLWSADDSRNLQDPLSFRTGVYLLGAMKNAFDDAYAQLLIQLNSSDDNPGVAVDVLAPETESGYYPWYVDGGGAVLPTANFETLPWIIDLEKLAITIGHASLAIAQQVIKLNDDGITSLTRFLGTKETFHAFGAMEKPTVYLAMQNKELAMPVSMNYFSMAGGIEDVATNAASVVRRMEQQISNMYDLLGIQIVHAAQAIDLRATLFGPFNQSKTGQDMYNAIREDVEFLAKDRPLAPDFAAASQVLRSYFGRNEGSGSSKRSSSSKKRSSSNYLR